LPVKASIDETACQSREARGLKTLSVEEIDLPPISPTGPFQAVTAETQYVDSGGVRYAFRRLGASDRPPLLFIQRFGGTMDDWDPYLLEILAAERSLLLFDNAGIGRSTGETASTFSGIARAAADFVAALGLREVDVLGWSMGGYVASHLALDRPDLVRRLILASSGPGYVDNAPPIPMAPQPPGNAPLSGDDEYLFLFFKDTPSGRAAGAAHLDRLSLRPDRMTAPPTPASRAAQLAARGIVMTPEGSLLPKFATLSTPILLASGQGDIRIPSYYPYVASQALPDGKLILYPDSGHAFMFQWALAFGRDALGFLRD
jgi:pimeloyl-ACP methyl ester carboxylesterase